MGYRRQTGLLVRVLVRGFRREEVSVLWGTASQGPSLRR